MVEETLTENSNSTAVISEAVITSRNFPSTKWVRETGLDRIVSMEAIRTSVPQVVQVAGVRELPMSVIAKGVERSVNLIGVTQGYQEIRRLLILRGRYFDATDM